MTNDERINDSNGIIVKQDAAREARIKDERRRLRPPPWAFTPSQVFGISCPYSSDAVGFHSWRKATEQCAAIIAADPTYFQRPPKE